MSLMGALAAGSLAAQEASGPAPEGPVPAELHEPEEQTARPTPGAPTVSLARAVELALEGNFGLLSAVDQLEAARLRETAARSQFYPRLTPTYRRGEADDHSLDVQASQALPWSGAALSASGAFNAVPGADPLLRRSSTLTLRFTQPLLRGFGPTATYFDLVNSRRGREGQERALDQARQQLAVEVVEAFYQVIRQRQLLEVSRGSLERSQQLLASSEARVRVGLASRLDVLRAQLEAAQAQEGMVAAQAALETGLERFRVLLGCPPTDPLEPEAVTLREGADAPLEPLEVLLGRAAEHRSELHESRDQIRDAERQLALARQTLLPRLDFNVELGRVGLGPSFSDSWRNGSQRVTVFLSTSYPLQRSAERSQKAVSELEAASRRRSHRQREYLVEAEVRAAVRALERLRKSIELQRQAVELARQQRRLATLRYQRGLESNFDVVDAERRQVLARSALVSLLADYQVGRAQLARATGTLDPAREFAP